ncbi:hypothetical protein CsSME_00037305 [Camellia sinensis var. sinensis]
MVITSSKLLLTSSRLFVQSLTRIQHISLRTLRLRF